MYTRSNAAMAGDVDTALTIETMHGVSRAWMYLELCQVPPHVILRVLADPELRRAAIPAGSVFGS